MWKLLGVILIFQPNIVLGKLVGDHVCLTEESYIANVTEYHIRNATVRSYQWCMNFPPRCSFYSTRKINETKSVEKHLTRIVENCCEGFIEKSNKCISKCHECKNGICEDEKCICSTGFKGLTCDVACDRGSWGKNCSLKCNCMGEQCDPQNGNCILNNPDTTTTYTTFKPTISATLTPMIIKTERITVSLKKQTTNIIEIDRNSLTETPNTMSSIEVNRLNEKSESTKTIYTTEETYYTTPYLSTIPKTSNELTTSKRLEPFVSTSTIPIIRYQTTTPSITKVLGSSSIIPLSKYQTTVPTTIKVLVSSSTISKISDKTMTSTVPEITKVLEYPSAITTFNYQPTTPVRTEVPGSTISIFKNQSTTPIHITETTTKVSPPKNTQISRLENEYKEILIPVEIKYEPIKKHSYKKEALSTTPDNSVDENSFSNLEDRDYINRHISSEENSHINNVSIAGTTILIIAVLVISLIGIHNIRKSKITKNEVKKEQNCPTVALYTTSIFHTPLPDPPTFDNPSYLVPAECRKYPNEQISFKAHIICGNRNLDLANEIKDCREYVYDHPPSTGSYRAASTVEPTEMNLSQSLTALEPVYDEIPNRNPEIAETSLNYTISDIQPSTIYINTCGRTKF